MNNILWVDDEIELLKPHIIYLKSKGYHLTTAKSGDEALELIDNHDKDSYPGTVVELVYETPNYKVWIGDFFSQLEADKKLLKIKNT